MVPRGLPDGVPQVPQGDEPDEAASELQATVLPTQLRLLRELGTIVPELDVAFEVFNISENEPKIHQKSSMPGRP